MQPITNATSRALTKQLSSLFKSHKHAVNIASPVLCEKAISRLDLSAYKNSIVVDMSPGVCTWSAALHDAIKPRAHILLEPEKLYRPWIEEFQSTRPNTYWLPEHGDSWSLYLNMFGLDKPPPGWPKDYPNITPRTVPLEDGINTDILFTGNLSQTGVLNNRFMAQLIATIPRERWLMMYGRVRFLLWILDETKVRYIPRTVASRGRATVMAEAVCDITEVASSNTIPEGRGHPKASVFSTDAQGNLTVETHEEMHIAEEKPANRKPGRPRGSKKKRPGAPEEPGNEATPGQDDTPAPKGTLPAAQTEEQQEDDDEWDLDAVGPKQPLERLVRRLEKAVNPSNDLKTSISLIQDTLEALQERYAPTAERANRNTAIPKLRTMARGLTAAPLPEDHSYVLSIIVGRLKEYGKSYRDSMRSLTARLKALLDDPATECTRIEGIDHPAWFYRDDIDSLATALLEKKRLRVIEGGPATRLGKNMRAIKLDDHLLGALERPEETTPPPPPKDEGVQRLIAAYNKYWGSNQQWKDPYMDIKEDELFSYENKLLEFHRRDYEPITVQPSDFSPETPLALLDFAPKLTHPYLRNADEQARDRTWETFTWLLRTLFLLRAHTIGTALATLAPGAEHILTGLAIDADQRTRTLSADQLVDITRAWEAWPFRGELLHLEEYMGAGKEAEALGNASHLFRVRSLKLGR